MLNLPQQSSQPQPSMAPEQGAPMPQGQAPMQGDPNQQAQAGPNVAVLEQIEQYISGLSPEEQDLIKEAASAPVFPAAMGALFGSDMQLYFTEIQNKVLSQQNSQPQTTVGPENAAQAGASSSQPQAKATSPGLNVPGNPM